MSTRARRHATPSSKASISSSSLSARRHGEARSAGLYSSRVRKTSSFRRLTGADQARIQEHRVSHQQALKNKAKHSTRSAKPSAKPSASNKPKKLIVGRNGNAVRSNHRRPYTGRDISESIDDITRITREIYSTTADIYKYRDHHGDVVKSRTRQQELLRQAARQMKRARASACSARALLQQSKTRHAAGFACQ